MLETTHEDSLMPTKAQLAETRALDALELRFRRTTIAERAPACGHLTYRLDDASGFCMQCVIERDKHARTQSTPGVHAAPRDGPA